MSRWEVCCASCMKTIGAVYDSAPHQIYCVECADESDKPEPEGGPCAECGVCGCNGECFGDDMMGDN